MSHWCEVGTQQELGIHRNDQMQKTSNLSIREVSREEPQKPGMFQFRNRLLECTYDKATNDSGGPLRMGMFSQEEMQGRSWPIRDNSAAASLHPQRN